MATAETPVFRLYLLRHGHSGWAHPGQKDFDRTLDDAGFAEAEILADMAADKAMRPDLILSSTAMRCRQTAQAMRRAMGEDLRIDYVDALYAGPASVYLDLINGQTQTGSVMVVGHNPMMEELLHETVGAAAAAAAIPNGYPTAGLAIIDFDQRPDGADLPRGRLVGLMKPAG